MRNAPHISFLFRIEAFFLESELFFPELKPCLGNLSFIQLKTIQIQSFFSNLLLQLKFQALFPELKLCFRNSFLESDLRFQINRIIQIRTLIWNFCFNSNLKLRFRNRNFDSRNEASNLSRSNNLETKFQIWIVVTSWKRSSDPEKEASIPEAKLQFRKQSLEFKWSNNLESKLLFQKRSLNFENLGLT